VLLLAALAVTLGGCERIEQPVSTATRFAARMSCSCVFVSGRELPACIADLPSQATWLEFEVDPVARTVAASALWITGIAQFSEGRGCSLRD
jgi:hypothetical protein